MSINRQDGRTRDFRNEILITLRGNQELCDILEYDPSTEKGPNAAIYEADPPWDPDHDAAVVVGIEPDGTTRDNHAHNLSFVVSVTFEVRKQWYTEDFSANTGGRRYRVFDLIDETMVAPQIPNLINRRGVDFTPSEPDPNYARAWAAVYNYERTI